MDLHTWHVLTDLLIGAVLNLNRWPSRGWAAASGAGSAAAGSRARRRRSRQRRAVGGEGGRGTRRWRRGRRARTRLRWSRLCRAALPARCRVNVLWSKAVRHFKARSTQHSWGQEHRAARMCSYSLVTLSLRPVGRFPPDPSRAPSSTCGLASHTPGRRQPGGQFAVVRG